MIGLKCHKCGFLNNAEFQIYITGEGSGKKEAIHSCKNCGHVVTKKIRIHKIIIENRLPLGRI